MVGRNRAVIIVVHTTPYTERAQTQCTLRNKLNHNNIINQSWCGVSGQRFL